MLKWNIKILVMPLSPLLVESEGGIIFFDFFMLLLKERLIIWREICVYRADVVLVDHIPSDQHADNENW